jgi:carbon-monoxide dehydrogenase large subunit
MEIPECVLDHLITPNPFTPGGYKGAGETGTVSPVPCLANAAEDALRPLGVRLRKMPLLPPNIWQQIQEAAAVERDRAVNKTESKREE